MVTYTVSLRNNTTGQLVPYATWTGKTKIEADSAKTLLSIVDGCTVEITEE